jgi:hypothetical protein
MVQFLTKMQKACLVCQQDWFKPVSRTAHSGWVLQKGIAKILKRANNNLVLKRTFKILN